MIKNYRRKTAGKAILFAIILIILILIWTGSYWLKNHQWPWVELQKAIENAKNQEQEKTAEQSNEPIITEKSAEQKKSELFRQGTMNDLATKIGKLSLVKPVLGGSWYITRFWFADDRNLYVEYEDGHIMARILVEITGAEEKPEYKVVASFEPGENDWIIKTGKDTMLGKKLDLYEYSETEGEWVKKN